MKYSVKQCSLCFTEFTPKSGKQKFCSPKCFNKVKSQKVMKRREDPMIREAYNASQRKWRASNQKHCSEWARYRYHSNPSVRTAKKLSAILWFRNNREHVRSLQAIYYKQNYCLFAAKNMSRQARQEIDAQLVQDVFKRDGYTCQYCGIKNAPLSLDHITPVVNGGTSDEDNLCVACLRCNCSKGKKTLLQFLLYQRELAC